MLLQLVRLDSEHAALLACLPATSRRIELATGAENKGATVATLLQHHVTVMIWATVKVVNDGAGNERHCSECSHSPRRFGVRPVGVTRGLHACSRLVSNVLV